MDWFKLHSDFVNDPKMRRYFTKSERLDWVNFLCLACKSKSRGSVEIPDDEIAYALELADTDWSILRDKFIERRMICREDDGSYTITHWVDRQYDKPSDTPEATRQRKAGQRQRESIPMSRPVTPCHNGDIPDAFSVTPPSETNPFPTENPPSFAPDIEDVSKENSTLSRPVTPCHAIEENRGDTEESRRDTEETFIHTLSEIPTHSPPEDGGKTRFGFLAWFETVFWPIYPNKVGKAKAQPLLRKFVTSEERAGIVMAGLDRFLVCSDWRRGFIHHADTWVRGRLWEDTPTPASATAIASAERPKSEYQQSVDRQKAGNAAYFADKAAGLIPEINLRGKIGGRR